MKFGWRGILLALFAVALVGGAGAYLQRERILLSYYALKIPKSPLEAREQLIAPTMQFFPPQGASPPYPAVIQLHGCGGMRQGHMEQWTKIANEHGYMAVVVDSYAPRGITRERARQTVCQGKEFIGQERAGDALAAFRIVSERKDVDPSKIVLAGWSHGGWTAMDLVAMTSAGVSPAGIAGKPENIAPAGLILFYPYCGRGAWSRVARWRPSPPTLALVAGADTVVNAKECEDLFAAMKSRGGDVDLVVYDKADHSFDDMFLPNEYKYYFNADAEADAEIQYAAFLEKLRGG